MDKFVVHKRKNVELDDKPRQGPTMVLWFVNIRYSCRLRKLFTYRSYITVAIFKTLYSKAPNQRTPTSGTVPKVRNW